MAKDEKKPAETLTITEQKIQLQNYKNSAEGKKMIAAAYNSFRDPDLQNKLKIKMNEGRK